MNDIYNNKLNGIYESCEGIVFSNEHDISINDIIESLKNIEIPEDGISNEHYYLSGFISALQIPIDPLKLSSLKSLNQFSVYDLSCRSSSVPSELAEIVSGFIFGLTKRVEHAFSPEIQIQSKHLLSDQSIKQLEFSPSPFDQFDLKSPFDQFDLKIA